MRDHLARPAARGRGPDRKGDHRGRPAHAARHGRGPGHGTTRRLRADRQGQPADPVRRLPAGAIRTGRAFAAEDVSSERGHGRTEQRTTRTMPVTDGDGIDFPHAAQVFRIRRDTGGLDGQRIRKETAYCITSLAPAQAGPARLGALVRGTGRSRTESTGSAMSPTTRTAPRSAPVLRPRSWPACATWPSAPSAWPVTPTSPPPSAGQPATITDH